MSPLKIAVRILAAAVLAAAALCALPAAAPAQSTKAPVEQLAEELDLTFVQIMDLKTVFGEYTKKRKELADEQDAGVPQEEIVEKQQRLQREFYEELSRILTPVQVVKYQEFIQRGRPAGGAGPVEGELGKLPPAKAAFPWIETLKGAMEKLELSGLQKQAMNELSREMESHAAQMLYWDPEYKPEEDPELVSLLETRLEWIMTSWQRQEYMDIVAAAPAGGGKEEKGVEQPVSPEYNGEW